MTQQRPQIGDAQAKSIAAFSKVEAKKQAYAQRFTAMSAEQQRSVSKAISDIRASSQAIQGAIKWFPRIAFCPIFILALALVWIVIFGLWSGDFPAIQKHSKTHIFLATEPVAYWFAATYHAVAAALFIWLSIHLFRASEWVKKKP